MIVMNNQKEIENDILPLGGDSYQELREKLSSELNMNNVSFVFKEIDVRVIFTFTIHLQN